MSKNCISSQTRPQLAQTLAALGQPAFRAGQIYRWLHQKQVTEFSAMTDQPKALLKTLEEQYYIAAPTIRRRQQSKDGTVKYLFALEDGNCIETVVMRYKYGNTVCLSTQVGCRMGCRFCASTQAGRVRTRDLVYRGPTLHRPAGISGSVSPISCSWASANRWTISIT